MASLAGPQSESTALLTGSGDAAAWKPRSALTGTLLANRYKITGPVGQGSTGAVFRADDVISGKPVAVRVLVPALAQLPGLIPRIRARIERNTAIQQRDPAALINLVDIFDVGMTLEGELFVVSDFLDGDHLATMLTRGGRLPWSRARSLLIRLCQIVHGLHQEGIVLGGLEARHCYAIRGKNKHEAIKVVNNAVFEQLASTIGPHAGHGATILARYVAPEQACGDPIDARSDVYSFGIIAYELVTGSVPFTDANPVRLVSMHLQRPPRPPREAAPDAEIPAEVEAALLRSLAKDPADRFPTMDAFAAALSAVPESSQHSTGSHAIVPASLAASEIPTEAHRGPTEAARTPSAEPSAAATSSPATPATTSTSEASTASGTPRVEPSTPERAAAPSPEANPAPAAPSHETNPAPAAPSPEANPAHAPTPSEPPTLATPASNVPVPGRRFPSIPTHVTLPPGSMTSDVIRGGVASPPTLAAQQARPATLPPTLGGLRLPPPPTLGRPATIPPGGLNLPPPPAATPRLGANVPVATPRAPSAALPAGTLLRAGLPPHDAAPVPTDSKPVLADSKPVLADSPVPAAESTAAAAADRAPSAADTPPAADTKPITADTTPVTAGTTPVTAGTTPTATDTTPAPSDSKPVSADSPATAPTDSKPAAADSPAPTPSPAAFHPLAAAAAAAAAASKPVEEPRAASSSARRPVIKLTEVRKEGDTASASGAYLRSALAAEPTAAAEATRAEPAAEKPRLIPAARPSDDLVRSAALQHGQVTGPQAALSQVSGTTDSLVAEVPRSRGGLWIVLGLAAAAGIAALVLTSPSFTTPREDPIARAPAKAPDKAPGKLADATPAGPVQDPERGAGVVDPPRDAKLTPPVDPPPTDPPTTNAVPTAVPEPDPEPDPEPVTKPGKKDPKKKKTPRVREEPEEPEKDVFDQLREHMAAKKAAEEAAKKAASSPTPAPTPTPTPVPANKPDASEADKAKETLDRAKQAAAGGNQALAYSLAKQSYGMAKTQEALELMGVSACRLKNVDNARSALGSLSGGRRDSVVSACNQAGVTL